MFTKFILYVYFYNFLIEFNYRAVSFRDIAQLVGVADMRANVMLLTSSRPGATCVSSSALVRVNSTLALMKYGLMAHFQSLKLQGGEVSTALWGGTPHIQTVF